MLRLEDHAVHVHAGILCGPVLTDPNEREIIGRARQAGVRDPNRSRAHFDNIFSDFLSEVLFKNAELVDLGPGQFDFGVMARERGARRVVGIDNDPAVLELGRHKGFEVREANLRTIDAASPPEAFDGVFCKFSLNVFWHADDADREALVDQVAGLVRPGAWSWIAPWNGAPKRVPLTSDELRRGVERQAQAFRAHGYAGYDLTEELAKRYGVTGAVVNRALFVRGLPVPRAVAQCVRL